jgi:DNA-binding transcriptional ArsR family regulator
MLRASCVRADQAAAKSEAVVVRLVHKAVAMDAALRLVEAGELQPQDMAVLWYIASSLDRQTGEAIRRYQTIAEGCGMSRASAVRAMARLKAAGVIEIRERYFQGRRGKVATAYRLGAVPSPGVQSTTSRGAIHDTSGAQVGSQVNRGSVHGCTGNSPSHDFHNPVGGPDQHANDAEGTAGDPVTWSDTVAWLHRAGCYAQQWGSGSEALAEEDLDRWRRQKGDRAILRAVEKAQELGLYRNCLLDFMENTYPARRRGAA